MITFAMDQLAITLAALTALGEEIASTIEAAQDCTMTLYTRPLAGVKGKFLGRAGTHSYLVLTDPNSGNTVTIDGTHVGDLLQDEIVPQSKGYGDGDNSKAKNNYNDGTQVIPCLDIDVMELKQRTSNRLSIMA